MPCIKCENNGNLSIFQQLFFAFIHPSSKPQSSLLHICTIIFLFYFFSFSSFVGNSGWIEFSRTYTAPIGFSRLHCECYHARKWRKSLCKLRQQKSRWCSRLLKTTTMFVWKLWLWYWMLCYSSAWPACLWGSRMEMPAWGFWRIYVKTVGLGCTIISFLKIWILWHLEFKLKQSKFDMTA